MLSSVALRQRSWNDYYNGWYQSRFAPVDAALKADPRCPAGSVSTFDEPRNNSLSVRLRVFCSYPYKFDNDDRELCRPEHNVSKAACWEVRCCTTVLGDQRWPICGFEATDIATSLLVLTVDQIRVSAINCDGHR